ncbi:uncharacterized protein VTP21DRAFT_7331 [Calcarisporiella thermophila]|uniref:uncharacterized protein n=1 Tax=Calcarisporiella thermophila TaxID=911321 RepID=UPI00374389CC
METSNCYSLNAQNYNSRQLNYTNPEKLHFLIGRSHRGLVTSDTTSLLYACPPPQPLLENGDYSHSQHLPLYAELINEIFFLRDCSETFVMETTRDVIWDIHPKFLSHDLSNKVPSCVSALSTSCFGCQSRFEIWFGKSDRSIQVLLGRIQNKRSGRGLASERAAAATAFFAARPRGK